MARPVTLAELTRDCTDRLLLPPLAGSREPQHGKADPLRKGPPKPTGILGSVLPKPVARTVGPKMVKFRSNVQELGFRVSQSQWRRALLCRIVCTGVSFEDQATPVAVSLATAACVALPQ